MNKINIQSKIARLQVEKFAQLFVNFVLNIFTLLAFAPSVDYLYNSFKVICEIAFLAAL